MSINNFKHIQELLKYNNKDINNKKCNFCKIVTFLNSKRNVKAAVKIYNIIKFTI